MRKRHNLKGLALGTVLAATIGYVVGAASTNKDKNSRPTSVSLKQDEEKIKLIFSELSDLLSNLADSDSSELSERALQRYETAIRKGIVAKEQIAKYIENKKLLKVDNKDLKLAIKEAEKAIYNLKAYLLKK